MTKKLLFLSGLVISWLTFAAKSVEAQIRNKAIPAALGNDSAKAADGTVFTSYFITLWRGIIFIGAILVLVYFLWGGIEWITAAGDSAKVGKARDKLTQSVVGLIILVASFSIIGFISTLFFGPEFNLLNLTIPTPTT